MSNRKMQVDSPLVRSMIHCFFYIRKGEAQITIGDKSYLFKGNECAIIPAGQVFSVQYYNNCVGFMGGFHTDYLSVDNDGSSLLRTFSFLRKWGNHKIHLDESRKVSVNNILERLLFESENARNKEIIKAYLTTLLVEMDVVYKESGVAGESQEINNRLCNQFIEMVFEEVNHSLPISYYAEKLNVSSSHLHRNIKSITEKTPLTWINEAVILEAKIMLVHTNLTIDEIAEKVGIQDASYFARLFKRQTGKTPVAFRSKVEKS